MLRRVDQVVDHVGVGQVAVAPDVVLDTGANRAPRRGGEVRVEVRWGGRQRPAKQAKAAHEDRLELPDGLAFDAHHDVVKGAVEEVILEAGATNPADATV